MRRAERVDIRNHVRPAELTATNLSMAYGPKQVLRNINFTFGPGCLHVKGRNGAGKSTLINILAGAVAPTAGEVVLNQIALAKAPLAYKKLSSLVPDEPNFFPYISGRDYLRFVLSAKSLGWSAKLDEMLSDFGLASQLDSKLGALSLGSKKKLFLAAGLHSCAALLLLDEPRNGLDSAARKILIDWCRAQAAEKIIIFASHDTAFAASLAAIPFELDHYQPGNSQNSAL